MQIFHEVISIYQDQKQWVSLVYYESITTYKTRVNTNGIPAHTIKTKIYIELHNKPVTLPTADHLQWNVAFF